MTYQEFKKEYKELLNKYPDLYNIYKYPGEITCIITEYLKNGERWEKVGIKYIESDWIGMIDVINSASFFISFRALEYIKTNNTIIGVIPTRLISISPNRRNKITYEFKLNKAV